MCTDLLVWISLSTPADFIPLIVFLGLAKRNKSFIMDDFFYLMDGDNYIQILFATILYIEAWDGL